ncbi:MAG: hypothetical protein DRI84_07905 [Bacteroidetes bacterium]|nr:MAG: hypothetical protein DRI84_07905 [Bacteroidota bacterium]
MSFFIAPNETVNNIALTNLADKVKVTTGRNFVEVYISKENMTLLLPTDKCAVTSFIIPRK